jgi:hypothetical protein
MAGFFHLPGKHFNLKSMKTKAILSATIFLFAAFFISSCKKENKTAPIQLLLTDKPADYDSVNVHIIGMQVKINHDGEPWIPINVNDSIYNLLDLQNGITAVIAQDTIPIGVLKEVRFVLGSDNYVVVNGSSYPLITPSAEESGLKVKIDKALNETLNIFTLDFDALLSIKEETGTYRLSPVIKMKL